MEDLNGAKSRSFHRFNTPGQKLHKRFSMSATAPYANGVMGEWILRNLLSYIFRATRCTTITCTLLFPALAMVTVGISLVGCSPRSSKAVAETDRLMLHAFLEYAHGSFESASNALWTYTAFLDAHQKQIASHQDYNAVDLNGKDVPFSVSRDMPVTQFTPHSMLACMMIYSGNTNEALHHLSRAYPHHVQIRTRAQRSPVARQDFVQFILDSSDKIDAKTGAAWKAQFGLDTNVVSGIVAAWIQESQPKH